HLRQTNHHRPQGRLVRRFELFVHLFRNDQDRASLDEGIANPQEPGRGESWMLVQFMSLQSVPRRQRRRGLAQRRRKGARKKHRDWLSEPWRRKEIFPSPQT